MGWAQCPSPLYDTIFLTSYATVCCSWSKVRSPPPYPATPSLAQAPLAYLPMCFALKHFLGTPGIVSLSPHSPNPMLRAGATTESCFVSLCQPRLSQP